MIRSYTKPSIEIDLFRIQDVITASSTAPTLTNGKENGLPIKEKFSSLFGDN